MNYQARSHLKFSELDSTDTNRCIMFILKRQDVEIKNVPHPSKDQPIPILYYQGQTFRLLSVFTAAQEEEAMTLWRDLTDNRGKACVLLEEPDRFSIWGTIRLEALGLGNDDPDGGPPAEPFLTTLLIHALAFLTSPSARGASFSAYSSTPSGPAPAGAAVGSAAAGSGASDCCSGLVWSFIGFPLFLVGAAERGESATQALDHAVALFGIVERLAQVGVVAHLLHEILQDEHLVRCPFFYNRQ
jgi:hypothetical protein